MEELQGIKKIGNLLSHFLKCNTNYCVLINRTHLETTIKSYNHYHDVHGGSGGIKSREVNGRLVLEGVLRLYWGVQSAIQLKEDDDQRLPSNGAEEKITQRKVSSSLGYQVLRRCLL